MYVLGLFAAIHAASERDAREADRLLAGAKSSQATSFIQPVLFATFNIEASQTFGAFLPEATVASEADAEQIYIQNYTWQLFRILAHIYDVNEMP